MARRLVKNTYGYEIVGPEMEVRREYFAGAEIPDFVRVEDESAVENFEAEVGPGTSYRDYQIAEGASSSDPTGVSTEEVSDDAGNTIRRTAPSKKAQENMRLRERSVGKVAEDDEKAAKASRAKSSEADSE